MKVFVTSLKCFDSPGHVPKDAGKDSRDLRGVYLSKLLLGLGRWSYENEFFFLSKLKNKFCLVDIDVLITEN